MSDNNFTLDELKLIQDNLHWNDCAETNQKLLQINNKLQEMIDNYCEHDWEQTHIEIELEYCNKCGIQAL